MLNRPTCEDAAAALPPDGPPLTAAPAPVADGDDEGVVDAAEGGAGSLYVTRRHSGPVPRPGPPMNENRARSGAQLLLTQTDGRPGGEGAASAVADGNTRACHSSSSTTETTQVQV